MQVLGYKVYYSTKYKKYFVEVKNDSDFEYHLLWFSNTRTDAVNTAILLARTLEKKVPVLVQRIEDTASFKIIYEGSKKK